MKLLLIAFFSIYSFVSCIDRSIRYNHQNKNNRYSSRFADSGEYARGKCSYYGKKFHGRKTANGEVFDMYKLTAAHRSLPFGTIVKVENIKNGKSVAVRINDRGPFKADRIIDLSYAAAKELGMINDGIAEVNLFIIKKP